MPSNPLSLKDSGWHRLTMDQSSREYPQTNNPSVIDALQERIAFREKDLVEKRLQLACAKSSEDILKLELARMRSADAKATSNKSTSSLFGANEGAVGKNEDTHQENTAKIFSVPTTDPFSRKKNAYKVHRGRRTSTKALNPGSCSSGMDLLALAQLGSNGSLSSLHRARRVVLNPNSCASGLNLVNGLQASNLGSMRSMLSGISASGLLRPSQRNNASSGSLSSGNNFALLLGNARIVSSSSLRRGNSSRNNTRLKSNTTTLGSKRNADWGVFE
jgi:hypothetical protein